MPQVNTNDLKQRYLLMAHRAAAGDTSAQMAMDMVDATMEDVITEDQARAISAAWKRSGVHAAHTLFQSIISQAAEGKVVIGRG